MDELYRLIESKIKASGYPGGINGREFYEDVSDEIIQNARDLGLDCLIVIGGDGTMAITHELKKRTSGNRCAQDH